MTETLIEAPATRPALTLHAAADFVALDEDVPASIVGAVESVLDVELRISDDDRMRRRERLLHQLALERQRQRRRRSA